MDRFVYALEHLEWGIGYIITIFVFVVVAFISEVYKNNKFIYIFLIYLIIFSSTRDIVNFDMENYKKMYENYKFLSALQIEPGFIFFSWLFNYVTSSPYLLFFSYSLLNTLFVFFSIKNLTPYIKSSLFLYLTIPMLYLSTLIGIRQSLAEAIMFFAASLLFKGKIFSFLFFGILSIMFHYSAVLILIIICLIYLFLKNRVKINFLFSIITISLILNFLNIDRFFLNFALMLLYPLLPEKYVRYAYLLIEQEGTALKGFSIYTTLLFNILSIFSIYCNHILIKRGYIHENYGLIINILALGTVYMNLFGEFSDVTARIFYYFIFYYTILIPLAIYRIHTTQIKKNLISYVMFIFLLIWLFSGAYKQLNQNEPPPLIYKNILLKDII